MTSLSIRVDETLSESIEKWTKELKLKKSDFIKTAIKNYIKEKEKEQFKKESIMTREESLKINKEFEVTLEDGI